MRDKYPTRSIKLRTEQQRELAINALKLAPLDPDKPLEILVREEAKARGLDANGLMWLRLGEIAEMAYFDGRRYSKEVWHDYCGKNVMPETVTTKDGEVRSKWEETPGGGMSVISTTKLERKCFSEYITAIESFGASLGVQFSENPRGQ